MESITVLNAGGQVASPATIDYDVLIRRADEARDALQAMRGEMLLNEWRVEYGQERNLVVLASTHVKDALEDLTWAVTRLTAAADTRGILLGAEEDNDAVTF